MTRRSSSMVTAIVTGSAMLACSMPLAAQGYPAKPVRILVGFAPGRALSEIFQY